MAYLFWGLIMTKNVLRVFHIIGTENGNLKLLTLDLQSLLDVLTWRESNEQAC